MKSYLIYFKSILFLSCFIMACDPDDNAPSNQLPPEQEVPENGQIVRTEPEKNQYIVTSSERKLFKVDAESGVRTEIHDFTELYGYDISSMAYVEDGVAYVTTKKNNINAVDLSTKELLWQTPIVFADGLSDDVPGVVCNDGLCYATGHNGAVLAVDQETGEEVWRYSIRPDQEYKRYQFTEGTPVINGNRIYIISEGLDFQNSRAVIHVLDKRTGERLMTADLPVLNANTPLVVNGTLLVPAGNLYALDAETLQTKWVFEADGAGVPFVANGKVVLQAGSLEDESKALLFALDLETGAVQWQVDAGFDLFFHPLIEDDVVFGVFQKASTIAFRANGRPFAVRLSDGEQIWYNENLSVDSSPVFANGRLFFFGNTVASSNRGLAFVDANTGEVVGYSKGFLYDFSIPAVVVAENGVFGPSYYRGN